MRYIEKHSKVSKSSFNKGDHLEADASELITKLGAPILISPKLLRSYGCGQVDLAVYARGKVIILEVKSRPSLISQKQLKRLRKSCHFLSTHFNAHVELKIINSLPNG